MLQLVHLVKKYKTESGSITALNDVSLTVRRGDRIGILGHNGSGKSTLIRLVGGIEAPTSGRVQRGMSVSWPLGFRGGIHPNLTAVENIRFIARIYGLNSEEIAQRVQEFSELGVRLRDPVRTYSAGMRAKLSFGISLAIEFDCYLIDEIVAFGDRRFRRKCKEELFDKRGDRSMLIVSHLPSVLRRYCNKVIVMRRGSLVDEIDINDDSVWRRYADVSTSPHS